MGVVLIPDVLKSYDAEFKLSEVENTDWKKEDKFDKFMDRLVSETISNVSMNFISGLKAY